MFEMANMTTHTIVAGLNGMPTPDLKSAAEALCQIPEGQHFTVTMRHVVGALVVPV